HPEGSRSGGHGCCRGRHGRHDVSLAACKLARTLANREGPHIAAPFCVQRSMSDMQRAHPATDASDEPHPAMLVSVRSARADAASATSALAERTVLRAGRDGKNRRGVFWTGYVGCGHENAGALACEEAR